MIYFVSFLEVKLIDLTKTFQMSINYACYSFTHRHLLFYLIYKVMLGKVIYCYSFVNTIFLLKCIYLNNCFNHDTGVANLVYSGNEKHSS